MSTLERAIEIAAKAHAGQVDKGNQPYILHPLRVMLSVTTPQEQITAVLHDIVEDTKITYEDLEQEGFALEIIEAVRGLTKLHGESRMDAAKRTRLNPLARIVKIADVTDNMNLERIPNPNKWDLARVKEYVEVLKILEE